MIEKGKIGEKEKEEEEEEEKEEEEYKGRRWRI